MLFVMDATDYVSDKILFSNLVNPFKSMGIEAKLALICEIILAMMASNFSSIKLAE